MTKVTPQPQRWAGQPAWSMEYWLYCNKIYNSIELASMLSVCRCCSIHYNSGTWYEVPA